MKNDEIHITEISDYESIKKIRNKILRPKQDISSCIFPDDNKSIHLQNKYFFYLISLIYRKYDFSFYKSAQTIQR